MRKEFNRPEVYTLAIGNTNEGPDRAPNPDYPGRVKCGICGEIFKNSVEYEAHKTQEDFGPTGQSLGTECPKAALNGILDAQMIPLS